MLDDLPAGPVQAHTLRPVRDDHGRRPAEQGIDSAQAFALVRVRCQHGSGGRGARRRRIHDHERVDRPGRADRGFHRLDGDLERAQHDIAGADHPRRGVRGDQPVRARRDRDRVLAPLVDSDQCDSGGLGAGDRELRTLHSARFQIGADEAPVVVVADATDEHHLRAERGGGRGLVRALAPEHLPEFAVGHRLARPGKMLAPPHQIDVRRPDHHHPRRHARKVVGAGTATWISDNGRIVTSLDQIRCLSIIAHIDHGKSTLADRLLELTGAVDARDMRAQYLDTMDLERERGITIKAQNVRLEWNGYIVNLIDTPGHVDFGYEVSRSLAACEGVILLVDASQGIEAQTLANCYLAMENDLTIVAALNKIDLPAAEPDKRAQEIERVLGIPADDVLRISAKTGEGVKELLDAIVERIPAPKGDADAPLQALMFDSIYDAYRGVVSSVRVFNGVLRSGARLRYVNAAQDHDAEEIGVRLPDPQAGRDARSGRGRLPHRGHQGRR